MEQQLPAVNQKLFFLLALQHRSASSKQSVCTACSGTAWCTWASSGVPVRRYSSSGMLFFLPDQMEWVELLYLRDSWSSPGGRYGNECVGEAASWGSLLESHHFCVVCLAQVIHWELVFPAGVVRLHLPQLCSSRQVSWK